MMLSIVTSPTPPPKTTSTLLSHPSLFTFSPAKNKNNPPTSEVRCLPINAASLFTRKNIVVLIVTTLITLNKTGRLSYDEPYESCRPGRDQRPAHGRPSGAWRSFVWPGAREDSCERHLRFAAARNSRQQGERKICSSSFGSRGMWHCGRG